MNNYKKNGSLAGIGLLTATVGLAVSLFYFSNKSLEDKVESPIKQINKTRQLPKPLSTKNMTAEEYLAGDPRLTSEGGWLGPPLYDRNFSNTLDHFYLVFGEKKAREHLETRRKILVGKRNLEKEDIEWVEAQISYGKYLEEILAEVDATKPRRQVVKFKDPIKYTPEVDKAIRFNKEQCFGYEPILDSEGNLAEIRTWLRLTGCSGPIDTETFEAGVKKYLEKKK